ncbi:hypothetical protein ES708_07037 [subsurface metagenome]
MEIVYYMIYKQKLRTKQKINKTEKHQDKSDYPGNPGKQI